MNIRSWYILITIKFIKIYQLYQKTILDAQDLLFTNVQTILYVIDHNWKLDLFFWMLFIINNKRVMWWKIPSILKTWVLRKQSKINFFFFQLRMTVKSQWFVIVLTLQISLLKISFHFELKCKKNSLMDFDDHLRKC
jgi:hypothetical protein